MYLSKATFTAGYSQYESVYKENLICFIFGFYCEGTTGNEL